MSVRSLLNCQVLRSVKISATRASVRNVALFHTVRPLWNEKKALEVEKPVEQTKTVVEAIKAATEGDKSVTESAKVATSNTNTDTDIEYIKPVPYKNADGITVYPPDY
ncbi:hypothetical protein K7432_016997, partial [Basidiobolus ranarum]